METFTALELRKSIRNYADQPVEAEKLEKLLWAGNRAPLGVPFHITAITNRALLSRINDKTRAALKTSPYEFIHSMVAIPGFQPLYRAPVLIILSPKNPVRGLSSIA
jgi:nitroreductase